MQSSCRPLSRDCRVDTMRPSRTLVRAGSFVPHAASSETFSPNASGVGAVHAVPTFAPTPLALGLNVKPLILDRVRYRTKSQQKRRPPR